MVELSHGGAWLKWDSLGRRDRNWALLSFASIFVAAFPLGIMAGRLAHAAGYKVGSGGREPPARKAAEFVDSDLFSLIVIAATFFTLVGAFAWWRFSRNQDEMFNRIQNYAMGHGAAWTLAATYVWWLLSSGRWVARPDVTIIVLLGLTLMTAFWFRAVRRWL